MSEDGSGERSAVRQLQIDVPLDKIEDFCRRWKVTEFAVFGSILREDFGPDSDVDILVSFADDAEWSLFDWVDMSDELSAILQREVDLVSRRGLEHSRNVFRRRAILSTAEVLYAA
jgi:hypothetical protein